MASAAREASLILRLVDQVTGPAKAITGALTGLNATMAGIRTMRAVSDSVAQAGRNMRRAASDASGLSIPMVLIGKEAAEAVYNFEKAGNAAQAYGDINAEQREELEKYAAALNEESPFTLNQIMDAANELFRAGLSFEPSMGALRGALQLGTAGDLDVATATDLSTNILTSMRLPMETAEQVQQSLQKVNDVLAYSAANSNADVLQMAEAFKYAGGVATAVGIPMDELATMFMVMAKNGIKGSEAGVALRSGIVRMLRPTLFAQRQLEQLNIEMGDFVTLGEKIDFSNIQNAVSSLTGSDLAGVQGPIEALLNDDILKRSPQKLVAKVMELVAAEVGASAADMEVIGDAVTQAIMTGAEKVDMIGFLKELNNKSASAVDMSYIWDVRQGSRLMSLLSQDLDELLAQFGDEVEGSAARMAATRLLGIVGVVNEFDAAVNDVYLSIANSGVLETVTQMIKAFTDWLDGLANLNPKILEFGTYALALLAVLAPLGLVLAGLAGAIAFIVNPITLIVAALMALAAANWQGVVIFWKSLETFFTQGLSPEGVGLLGQVVGFFQQLPQLFSGMWIKADLSTWGKNIGEGLASVVNAVPKFLEFMGRMRDEAQPVLDMIGPPLQAFGDGIGKIADMIGRLVGASWDAAITFLTNFTSSISPETLATWGRWGQVIADVATGLWSFIGAVADAIRIDPAAWNTFWTVMGQGFALVADLWTGTLDAVFTAIANISTTIVTEFSKINLWDMGARIIQSLIDGLLSKAAELGNAIMTLGGLINFGGAPASNGTGSAVINGAVDPGLPVPARAAGGPLWDGWFLAGEKGPELGYASGNGHMFNAQETKRMLTSGGGSGGGSGMAQTNHFHFHGSPEENARGVSKVLDRQLQRSRGLSMEDRQTFG